MRVARGGWLALRGFSWVLGWGWLGWLFCLGVVGWLGVGAGGGSVILCGCGAVFFLACGGFAGGLAFFCVFVLMNMSDSGLPGDFQELIQRLQAYWAGRGCLLVQPYDSMVGAGTFHPATFLRSLGPEPWSAAYVQAVRRPADGRYGVNPNRLQHYYQFQVLLKPAPVSCQQFYLDSLEFLGLSLRRHDLRFVEDDWASPTLGAWGLGWEVWLDGMEVAQFTYFQQVGGLDCRPVSCEITYGLERLAMYLQEVPSVYDLVWRRSPLLSYRSLYQQAEAEMSAANFEHADGPGLQAVLTQCELDCARLLEASLPLPAYDNVLRASHAFNLLDAGGVLSVTERQRGILRVRRMARAVAAAWVRSREVLGFPLLSGEGVS